MNAPDLLCNDRAAWLTERQSYLGGTDIAAIIGMNPWNTPYDIWDQKVNGTRNDAGRKAEAGTALEPLIRSWYSQDLGVEIQQLSEPVRHEKYPFLAANIDGIIPGVCVWECKTYDFGTADKWGEPGTDQIPVQYWAQAQWYTGMIGLPYCVVVALDRGRMEYDLFQVDHSAETFALMVDAGLRFWRDHVLTKKAPDLTIKDTGRIIELFPVAEKKVLHADAELDAYAERAVQLTKEIKERYDELNPLKDLLHMAGKEYAAIETSVGRIPIVRVKASFQAAFTKDAYSFPKLPRS